MQASTAPLQAQVGTLRISLDSALKARASSLEEAAALRTELTRVKSELELSLKVRETLSAEAAVLKTEVAETRAESHKLREAKASLTRDAEASRGQLLTAQTELADARKARSTLGDQVAALQSKLTDTGRDLEEARKVRKSLSADLDALRSQVATSRADLEESQRVSASLVESSTVLQSQVQEAMTARVALNEEVEMLRAQLPNGDSALCSNGARSELEAAWSAFVGPGLERLRLALVSTGVRAATTGSLADGCGAAAAPLLERRRPATAAPNAELPSADISQTSATSGRRASKRDGGKEKEDREGKEKHDRKDKKERKEDKKRRREAKRSGKAGKAATEECPPQPSEGSDTDVTNPSVSAPSRLRTAPALDKPKMSPIASVTEEVETSSQESDDRASPRTLGSDVAPLPHRTHIARRPALRSKGSARGQAASKGGAKNGIEFSEELASEVKVTSFRHLGEGLWYTNPQSNVSCERCKKRVPQRQGQLMGGTGGSSFMCDEFVCTDCNEGE